MQVEAMRLEIEAMQVQPRQVLVDDGGIDA